MGTSGRRALGVVALTGVLLTGCVTGCSAPDRGPSGTAAPPMARDGSGTVGAAATTTPAAELRAGLTWQLVERAQLLASARAAVLRREA
ncbi:MAG: hypothetical protein JWO60_2849, partial [Frankiales bacterium]|nr:hypothetical protein [Frankiales bacterium]